MRDLLTYLRTGHPLAVLGEPQALRLAADFVRDALGHHRIDGFAAPFSGAPLATVASLLTGKPLALVGLTVRTPLAPGSRYAIIDGCAESLVALTAAKLVLQARGDFVVLTFALVWDGVGDPGRLGVPFRYYYHATQLLHQRPPDDPRRMSPAL